MHSSFKAALCAISVLGAAQVCLASPTTPSIEPYHLLRKGNLVRVGYDVQVGSVYYLAGTPLRVIDVQSDHPELQDIIKVGAPLPLGATVKVLIGALSLSSKETLFEVNCTIVETTRPRSEKTYLAPSCVGMSFEALPPTVTYVYGK